MKAVMTILVPFIQSWEGGFCKVKSDRGGATNKGVTLATFRSVYGNNKTESDLKKMTDDQWQYIFGKWYWDRWKADTLQSQSIANLLVDWLWCSGSYGIRIPQSVVGVEADGLVGPKTIAAINGYKDERVLFDKLWKARKAYIERISKGSQLKFREGWLNRLNGIKYGKLVCNGGKVIDY